MVAAVLSLCVQRGQTLGAWVAVAHPMDPCSVVADTLQNTFVPEHGGLANRTTGEADQPLSLGLNGLPEGVRKPATGLLLLEVLGPLIGLCLPPISIAPHGLSKPFQ